MTNPFRDQELFMQICEQTTTGLNDSQFNLYLNLIQEETSELATAVAAQNNVETLDALVDILVVTIGAIHSMGADAEGAWKEVMRTNFAKVQTPEGKPLRREDGKILKPANWVPPNLTPHLTKTDSSDSGNWVEP